MDDLIDTTPHQFEALARHTPTAPAVLPTDLDTELRDIALRCAHSRIFRQQLARVLSSYVEHEGIDDAQI